MASSCSPENGDRHCAYCLIPISREQVKLCGKCGRRSYCSKECQTLDWKTLKPATTDKNKSEQRGQGHKDWGKLLCGEEGVDWRVAPVEGKGLGVIALKAIPARGRILVEAGQLTPQSHPGIQELTPVEEGSGLQEKWDLNKLGCNEKGDKEAVLGVRISRVNHDCNPNAMHVYCNTFHVKILFAERDIAPGEEICISYQSFKSPSTPISKSPCRTQICQLALRTKWGITCPRDCACTDDRIAAVVKRAVELDESILKLAMEGRVDQAMRGVKVLMDLHLRISSSYVDKRSTLCNGFLVGIMTKKTLPQGLLYAETLCDFMKDILHPESATMKVYEGCKNNPKAHPGYLIHEGGRRLLSFRKLD